MTRETATRGGFQPVFSITAEIAGWLMRLEALKTSIEVLPITPRVLGRLRETARLFSTHYSTMIEGNLLTQVQVDGVIAEGQHYAGREREEAEVRGYYAALEEMERLVLGGALLTEKDVQRIHSLVMGGGRGRVRATPYRAEQNVIRDSRTGGIVYMPPEAAAVPKLMGELVAWLNAETALPVPLKAAVAHYQFATIHPYYDGNGRTARLLTSLILHLGGYGLKGLYALEEYYARDLKGYYEALTVGPSHNYHLGRVEADITGWVGYFVAGMVIAFERVEAQTGGESRLGRVDRSQVLRDLDVRQRRVLALFESSREVTSMEIAKLFGFSQQNASLLCRRWVEEGFLMVANAARKTRRYRLVERLEALVSGA